MPLGFEGTFLFDAPPLYLSPGVEEELEKDPGFSKYIDKAIKSFIEDSGNESTEEERNEYAANRYLFGHNCWITVRCASPVEQLVISTYRDYGWYTSLPKMYRSTRREGENGSTDCRGAKLLAMT